MGVVEWVGRLVGVVEWVGRLVGVVEWVGRLVGVVEWVGRLVGVVNVQQVSSSHPHPHPPLPGPPDQRFLRAETCMFMVKLPKYTTEQVMRQRLVDAISFREDPLVG